MEFDEMSAAFMRKIFGTLLKTDYESIAVINAETGEAHSLWGEHPGAVIFEQRKSGVDEAEVEAYLRKACAPDDVGRILRETRLPYVKDRLKSEKTFSVACSLKQNEEVSHKRVVYAYLDEQKTTILCAVQNATELFALENMRRDQVAGALQTLQEQFGMNFARYDLKTKTLYNNSDMLSRLGYGEMIENIPEQLIDKGLIAPISVDEYREFFKKLNKGEIWPVTVACKVADGSFHWLRIDARLIYDRDDVPYQAIMSFKDIEEEREHAAVYRKWRNSIEHRKLDDYTLFRCNLSKGASFDKIEGALLKIDFDPALKTFNERTAEYAGSSVHPDDFDAYTILLNSENLLAGYYRGMRVASLNYRELTAGGGIRWLRVFVEMTQYPDCADIEVFLMYEPAENAQTENPDLKAHINSDPLTGILNRRAFIERFNQLICVEQPDAKHALILVDIDGFKRINSAFGHAVGDQALVDIAASLCSVVEGKDLLGRLGGDIFIICLRNVSGKIAVEQKAAQILALLRRAFSVDICLSASMGMALFPDDGKDFVTLYHNTDIALNMAKANGTDSFAVYNGELIRNPGTDTNSGLRKAKGRAYKSHMLLLNDNAETFGIFESLFGDQYNIESCTDEKNIISRLHRYGSSLSLILISLDIPHIDSFALLDRIRSIDNMNSVPVITLCRAENSELSLKSLRHGASDFILEPVDTELLKIRVNSAVSKAENERLRAQNVYLQQRSSDAAQFRTVYENTDTVVVEYNWEKHSFVYDQSISKHIAGKYDDRSLWQILMSDMVADVRDVKAMQDMIIKIANSNRQMSASMDLMLKTPSKARHWFTMSAFKRINDRNLPTKIILTFLDVNDDILASKKLRFQAEHDSLTELYNREYFLKAVEETAGQKPADSYILLCCDINDFRFINERFGRQEGDRLLKYAAEKLRIYANTVNGFAGRLSGDIFVILIPNEPGIIEKATDSAVHFFDDYPLNARITGRAGAYIISDTEMNADAMIDFASTAANSIKGRFASWLALYDDSMNEERLREKRISDRMEAALAEGQFDVYIQPQFHHATGQIVGAEALVRWIDPELGVISPDKFIPLFEKNGFITKMDEYVWDKAAGYLSSWIEKGNTPVPLSVNVSREDTNDPELCKKLLAIVDKYNIPIHLFRLEITESLFAEDIRRLISVVEELHDAGFLIEMDDFGSGYSSLNILKDVPVDILKLDMKFFSGEDNLERGGIIINAVLRMSRWLNMPVIAEGVELKEHGDFLLSVGCPTIQGYLYEKPMPATEFEKMLTEGAGNHLVSQNMIDTEMDIGSFWNPLSADSQVFNKYIGPAAVFEYHDGDYEILRVNKRFIDVMNISDLVSLSNLTFVHLRDEDKPKFKEAVLEARSSREDIKFEAGFDLEDGSHRMFCITLRAISSSPDRTLIFATLDKEIPCHLLENTTDLQEKDVYCSDESRDQNVSLQEMITGALSTIMSSSEDISFVLDKDLHYICCSRSDAQMLGLENERDIVGKTDYDLFEKKLADQLTANNERVLRTGKPLLDHVEQVTGHDGRILTVSASKYPLSDTSGNIVGLYGISRDITDQREKESQLELLTGSIPGGLASYSINEDGISMRYFNDGFFEFSGCSREEYTLLVQNDPLAFVFEEDKPAIRRIIQDFNKHKMDGHINGCIFRCHTKDGGYKWLSMKTVLSKLSDERYVVNVVQLDITEQQEEKERLRVSEEFNRLAIEQSGKIITRFDVEKRTLMLPDSFNPIFVLPQVLKNMPEEQIALGRVSPDTASAYTELFESIVSGKAAGTATYKQNSTKGWRWLEAKFTTVFSNTGKPVSAVISFTDITEQLEKEVVYNKWQQSLDERPEESYALFRCNLSKGASFDSWEGKLLRINFDDAKATFDERTAEYVKKCVYEEDRERFTVFANSNNMLAEYYRGHRSDVLEYREIAPNGGVRWLRLTVDLVEYPSSRDVEVYLMFEDIDEQKQAELLTLERSEKDPLTGVFNRAAFIARVERILRSSESGEKHALFMLDIDDFKNVNDTLGHGAGDQVLNNLTSQINAVLRRDDLIGRLGGDEFFVFMKTIPDREVAAAKAEKICDMKLMTLDTGETVTASIGIAMIPENGNDFDTLYKKVDHALYQQKAHGKNGFRFVTEGN